MTKLHRGCVVARGRALFVVWVVDGSELLLLPVVDLAPDAPRRAGDVPVTRLGDLVATCQLGAVTVIRTSGALRSSVHQVSERAKISGPLACLVVQAMVRHAVAASAEAKWRAERTTRQHHLADEFCVRM